jgi:ABC-type polysaccharide/polyol phosphate export permease
LDARELALVGGILSLFVLRAMLPILLKRMSGRYEASAGGRTWSWLDVLVVGVSLAVIAWVAREHPASVATLALGLGLVLMTFAVKGLLASRVKDDSRGAGDANE